MQALGADRTLLVLTFPGTGQRVFVEHLFVNNRLLSCFEGTDLKAPLRRSRPMR